jgi:hypothetical protein
MSLRLLLVLGGTAILGWSAAAAQAPVAASPGTPAGARIGDACPTFSWGGVAGAASYELVVYRLGEDGGRLELALETSLPGSVHGWTPSLDTCLDRGGRYAWSVGAVAADGQSEWSSPSLFDVAPGPSDEELEEALAIVRRYLAVEGEEAWLPIAKTLPRARPAPAGAAGAVGAMSARVPSGAAATAGAVAAPGPSAAAGGDPGMQVNGSPVVTAASQMFANVATDGTLISGSHVVSVGTVPPGEYDVTFDRNVSGCAFIATIGEPGSEPAGLIDASNFKGANVVTVFTQSNDGIPPPFSNRAFYLVVVCPNAA